MKGRSPPEFRTNTLVGSLFYPEKRDSSLDRWCRRLACSGLIGRLSQGVCPGLILPSSVWAKTSAGQEAYFKQNDPHPDPLPSDAPQVICESVGERRQFGFINASPATYFSMGVFAVVARESVRIQCPVFEGVQDGDFLNRNSCFRQAIGGSSR